MPDNLEAWLSKLELLNPQKIKLGLDRVRSVLDAMNLSIESKIVTVGGTNGKGSTVAVLESLLSNKGYSCGAYTSPHLFHFRERIRVNGEAVEDECLVEAFRSVEDARGETELTYFEFTTLAAAYLFTKSDLHFWLLEVGLGGRLDAVNIFEPDVTVVTNIGLDHQDWLGDTLEEIGAEKAGIYRHDRPAIFGSKERPSSIDKKIDDVKATPYLLGQQFSISAKGVYCSSSHKVNLNLPQLSNVSEEVLAAAITAMGCLGLPVAQDDLMTLCSLKLPARFERLSYGHTEIIADVAHNSESVALLAQRLLEQSASGMAAVVGFMADKLDKDLISPLLAFVDEWILVRPKVTRAASIELIKSQLINLGIAENKIHDCPDIALLPEQIKQYETVVIYGSFYTVGECLAEMELNIG